MPRFVEIVTPLDPDLLFHRLHAREELGRSGEFQIDLLSRKKDIAYKDILGKNVTVKLELPEDRTRYYNGFVTRFSAGGMYGRYYRYSAVVRSWLWFLTRTTDCKIFQDLTAPDIIKKVFGDHPTADFKFELTATYRKWTYCVQYRETDFNFISRLMEEEGMYYYVKHTDGHNTVVVTDSTSKHTPTAGYETIAFISPEQVSSREFERINTWDITREIQPGVYVHDDYDLERPSVELKTRKAVVRGYSPSDYEVYDYPGHYLQKPDGEQYAAVRIDELASQFETAHATTNARGLSVGALFTLDAHTREDQNREYLVLSATYDLEFGDYEAMPEEARTGYACSFVAMSSGQQFRARRATYKPFVQGPQTAVVVGPAGDEIYKDDYGRVKVQFHWDRYGKRDENSSCWIRVGQMWAGKGWGSVSTPRIGHEVIVDFLEGDPDQPIIIGSVHNAENKPPHTGVVSGLKSNTHKGSGFNEMTMDDTAGKEKITIHAQYDMGTTVQHDQTDTVNNNRTTTVAVDDTESIGANQKIDIGSNHTLDIGSNDKISIGSQQDLTVGADQTITVGGNRSSSIASNDEASAGTDMKYSAAANFNLAAGADLTADASANVKISGGATVDVAAGTSIKLSAAGSSIEIGPAGIKITSGALVTVMGSTIKLN